ncbi:MAG TPA: S1C family serine protease [Actinomycetota bacterium]|jgi:serine protease Do
MESLNELQGIIEGLAGSVGPKVVGVGQRWGVGSGIVIGPGQVLTNAHNLRGSEVAVVFADGRVEQAGPKGVDVDGDIAVLAVDTGSVEPIEWASDGADGSKVSLGSPVFAMSNPGGRGLRVTFGLVSGTERSFRGPRGRRIAGSIEHTAPLLPGSSGGPIVDGSGKLLGLNTNRLGEGFYLAIPADAAFRDRVAALAKGETPVRPRLGVGIVPPHVARGLRRAVGLPEVDGLLVRSVEEEGRAAAAGIKEGDLIVEAGGRPTATVDALHEALESANGSLEVQVVRGADRHTFTVSFK